MSIDKNTADYLFRQRWCNFKEEIRLDNVENISYMSLPFDKGNKMLTIGKVNLSLHSEEPVRYFMMPLAKAEKNETDTIEIDGQKYVDALQCSDYWQKMNEFLRQNNNVITFPNGWQLTYKNLVDENFMEEHGKAQSRPLGVQQSNTTLSVGDDEIAFKLERMLQFSKKENPEFEMNEKLMRENSSVMPKTYGYFVLSNLQNDTKSSAGIVQEYVKNQGDLWNYALSYLKKRLTAGYLMQKDLMPEENPHFMRLMKILGDKTAEMSECLSRADENPAFTPETVNEKIVHHYQKHLEFLLAKTRNVIRDNLENLPQPTKDKASHLLQNWDKLTGEYVKKQIAGVANSNDKLVRVHGDFHLGQVMVTKDNDLRFIDFAGEPAAPMEERSQKHISVRDLAGMYRSIKGYLGSASVEEFVAEASDEVSAKARRSYAEKAIKPLMNEASRLVLNGHSLKEPWLGLEVLRKNLYEVNYEVIYCPQMAYIAVNGLADMLQPQKSKQRTNGKKQINNQHL